MKKYRSAVIGCGNISVMHIESILALENVELVAVCDIKEDRAKKTSEKYHTKAYFNYLEMFEKENLDVVHLCLPHYLHTIVAREAFNYGINVLTEKPMSIDYDDAVKTVEMAEEKELQFGVIFQCRYNTPSQLIKNRILDNKLGKVKCASTILTWSRSDDYYNHSDWKGTWDKEGGGVIIDQAIHSIELANWFINSEPIEVNSSLHNRNHKTMVVEDTGEGIVKYKNGSFLTFYAMNNYLIDDPIEIRLVCENGIARLSYDKGEISYNDGTSESVTNQPQKVVSYTSGKVYWGSQHFVQIDLFYKALSGLVDLDLSGREALKIQKIICDIYKNNDNINNFKY